MDITDSPFSLDRCSVGQTAGRLMGTNYIYIGIAMLVFIIGMLIYNFYINKNQGDSTNIESGSDSNCTGEFCGMNKYPDAEVQVPNAEVQVPDTEVQVPDAAVPSSYEESSSSIPEPFEHY